ncbi:glycerate kinase [Mesobacillus zeae]|uniref:Glycerate kinase n=1 Tax=Mesobacillus zeae TaxID=1917180 RepID=A0A398BDE4_9BACI|nr:glycerate kinase [Mesobacillus zeae]RID85780.1 glycerate kinase [Mesobacillus zeae]
MRIVIAPDSFKESLTAYEAACSIEKGFRQVFPEAEYIKMPMADGGEGTVKAMIHAIGGEIIQTTVTGPLGTKTEAFFGLIGSRKTAVIEMASASGLHLVPPKDRNPLFTTTKGTGELILSALDQGAEHIILGIGGSATNDGGAGMAQALGIRLLDKNGNDIPDGGGGLSHLALIDISNLDPRTATVKIEVACDVNNPLTGPKGASAVFGPQKGADDEMVKHLDKNLSHFAMIIEKTTGKSIADVPGSGAAGGLGAGLLAFLPAKLKSGISIMMEATNLEEKIMEADLVITGEGKVDSQSLSGKTPVGVAAAAKKHGVPVILLAGEATEGSSELYCSGVNAIFSIMPGVVTREAALANASRYLERVSENIAQVIKIGKQW